MLVNCFPIFRFSRPGCFPTLVLTAVTRYLLGILLSHNFSLSEPSPGMRKYLNINLNDHSVSSEQLEGEAIIKAGYRKIGFLGTKMPLDHRARKRFEGFTEALAKAGIAKKDIQTSGINLSAQYDYNNQDGQPQGPRFIGYEASNQLTVKLRDIKRVGTSLDAMVAAGATNISGPTFSIDDPSPMLVQARGAALKSAKAQADYYAQAAGYRSARLVSISESNSGGQPPMPMMATARFKADAAPTTPVEPGQVSASVTLTVQYALER